MIQPAVLMLILSMIVSVASPIHASQPLPQDPAPCDGRAAIAAGSYDRRIAFGDRQRRYLLDIPTTYDPRTPAPMIFSLHGFASSPEQHRAYAEWNTIAETNGVIMVFPAGSGTPLRWNAGARLDPAIDGAAASIFGNEADDVGFLLQLVQTLKEELCVDPARIYINGLSNGAGMSYRMVCEAADVFAAMGGVAGAYALADADCQPSRPVSVIIFHDTRDNIVPYEGDAAMRLPAIAAWADAWGDRNRCAQADAIASDNPALTGVLYTACDAGAEVIFYTTTDGGHTWPGGRVLLVLQLIAGDTSRSISATEVMWAFFESHFLPTTIGSD